MKWRTAQQSREYLEKFMGYTLEQARLLQELFRHKLVHLAQPSPVIEDSSRGITWVYYHEDNQRHLWLQKLPPTTRYVEIDHVFHIGIFNLVKDIRNSVEGPTGYLTALEKEKEL